MTQQNKPDAAAEGRDSLIGVVDRLEDDSVGQPAEAGLLDDAIRSYADGTVLDGSGDDGATVVIGASTHPDVEPSIVEEIDDVETVILSKAHLQPPTTTTGPNARSRTPETLTRLLDRDDPPAEIRTPDVDATLSSIRTKTELRADRSGELGPPDETEAPEGRESVDARVEVGGEDAAGGAIPQTIPVRSLEADDILERGSFTITVDDTGRTDSPRRAAEESTGTEGSEPGRGRRRRERSKPKPLFWSAMGRGGETDQSTEDGEKSSEAEGANDAADRLQLTVTRADADEPVLFDGPHVSPGSRGATSPWDRLVDRAAADIEFQHRPGDGDERNRAAAEESTDGTNEGSEESVTEGVAADRKDTSGSEGHLDKQHTGDPRLDP